MSLEMPLTRKPSALRRLKGRLLAIPLEEASFSKRGFPGCSSASRPHLEKIIETFIEGHNLALSASSMDELTRQLDASFPPGLVGFAYEGVGLCFGLRDLVFPHSKSRLAEFAKTAGRRNDYIVMVGAGFAIARMPFGARRLDSYQRRLDPMHSWCIADGYGFHQGFFHWRRFIEGQETAPKTFNAQNRRLFDSGVGRSMWWVFGADAMSIANAISRFQPDRQADMWTGIGCALAYAGGGPPGTAKLLLNLAGRFCFDLLSGLPLAAHMRHKGQNAATWTDEACATLLNMSVRETSDVIISELDTYLNTWRGSEQNKWDGLYEALRERVRLRLAGGSGRHESFVAEEPSPRLEQVSTTHDSGWVQRHVEP